MLPAAVAVVAEFELVALDRGARRAGGGAPADLGDQLGHQVIRSPAMARSTTRSVTRAPGALDVAQELQELGLVAVGGGNSRARRGAAAGRRGR